MLKKFFATFLFAAMFLYSSITSAAYLETVTEGVDLSQIKVLAVGLPMHYKMEITEPTQDEFAAIVSNGSHVVKNFLVISYDDIIENVWRDSKIELKALQDAEARKIFKEHVAKYADAYVVATSANNNKFIQFFFEVRNSKTGEIMYVYTTQSRHYGRNLKGYSLACEDFYKRFDILMENAIKSAKKKNKNKN